MCSSDLPQIRSMIQTEARSQQPTNAEHLRDAEDLFNEQQFIRHAQDLPILERMNSQLSQMISLRPSSPSELHLGEIHSSQTHLFSPEFHNLDSSKRNYTYRGGGDETIAGDSGPHSDDEESHGRPEAKRRADRKSTRLNSSHSQQSRMPSSA